MPHQRRSEVKNLAKLRLPMRPRPLIYSAVAHACLSVALNINLDHSGVTAAILSVVRIETR